MSEKFAVSKQNKVRQLRDKASYDEEVVHQVLDAGIVAHVAFVEDGSPVVVPMIYARDGNTVFLHGARKARVIRLLEQNEQACLNVTLLDGISPRPLCFQFFHELSIGHGIWLAVAR